MVEPVLGDERRAVGRLVAAADRDHGQVAAAVGGEALDRGRLGVADLRPRRPGPQQRRRLRIRSRASANSPSPSRRGTLSCGTVEVTGSPSSLRVSTSAAATATTSTSGAIRRFTAPRQSPAPYSAVNSASENARAMARLRFTTLRALAPRAACPPWPRRSGPTCLRPARERPCRLRLHRHRRRARERRIGPEGGPRAPTSSTSRRGGAEPCGRATTSWPWRATRALEPS